MTHRWSWPLLAPQVNLCTLKQSETCIHRYSLTYACFIYYRMSGVGKSETAYRLAEAILAKHVRAGSSKKSFPAGLLTLYGQDFSDGSLHEVCMHVCMLCLFLSVTTTSANTV